MDGFFGIGFLELLVIAILALIVLGPERLPGVMREIARYIRQLRRLGSEFSSQFREELKVLDEMNPRKLLNEITDPNRPDPDDPPAPAAAAAKSPTPPRQAAAKPAAAKPVAKPATKPAAAPSAGASVPAEGLSAERVPADGAVPPEAASDAASEPGEPENSILPPGPPPAEPLPNGAPVPAAPAAVEPPDPAA